MVNVYRYVSEKEEPILPTTCVEINITVLYSPPVCAFRTLNAAYRFNRSRKINGRKKINIVNIIYCKFLIHVDTKHSCTEHC